MNRSTLIAPILAALALTAAPAFALTLSADQAAALTKAETYLNNLGNLEARFLQVNPDGSVAEGDLYVARPGKMRIDYDPPTQMEVIADGVWLIYVDKEVDEASYIDLDDTPAGLLLKKDVSFRDRDVALKDVTLGPGTVEITAAQAKDQVTGTLTFVFSDAPFELRQWRVRDAQNQEVSVTLFDARTGTDLDKNLFQGPPRRDQDIDPGRRGD